MLTVAVQTGANNVKSLVAAASGGRVAGSLTPPSAVCEGCVPALDAYFAAALHREPARRLPDATSMREALLQLRRLYG